MAKANRTKEIWHIPKRGSVHQTIYMVHVFTWDKFLGKAWSRSKQEIMASEMGKAGLTQSGKALTHQSVRTLLANVPKYLGFVFIDERSTPSRVDVTEVGHELVKQHKIEKSPKHKTLSAYKESGDLVEVSDLFTKQMSKLIITNPLILNDCKNILVFPFRMTLKLLLELDYLDKEEIGYILFHTKFEDEYDLLVEKIKNFRNLQPMERQREIDAYKNTEEGKLTLVKAPTAGYYMYLCSSTGLCTRSFVTVNKKKNNNLPAIKLSDKKKVAKILFKYKNVDIYDFKDNALLWNEYFTSTSKINTPFDVQLKLKDAGELLVIVSKKKRIIGSDVLSNKHNTFQVPVFEGERYTIVGYDLLNGKKLLEKKTALKKDRAIFDLSAGIGSKKTEDSKKEIAKKVEEMFSNKYQGFDREYFQRLEVLKNILSLNYVDNRRKGGRLEYLFFALLSKLKDEGVVNDVFWYGKLEKYGICEPAPGGKEGNPDVVFEIDDCLFVLELTTIRGIRAQWQSGEASSVPDHIAKFKNENKKKKTIGIFSAPSIHHQTEKNLTLNARSEKVGMIFEPCIEFAKYLSKTSRGELKKSLIDKSTNQLSK